MVLVQGSMHSLLSMNLIRPKMVKWPRWIGLTRAVVTLPDRSHPACLLRSVSMHAVPVHWTHIKGPPWEQEACSHSDPMLSSRITLFGTCLCLLVFLCSSADAIAPQSAQQKGSHGLQDVKAPPVWPLEFKATLFQNRTNRLALTTLYYDFKLGANLNIIASQLGVKGTVYDMEWNNGTSFIFSRDEPVCKVLHFEVGILTPDWLANATNAGETETDMFVVDVWTKADFIRYYAERDTGKPVRWTFLWSDAEFHVLDWEEGITQPKRVWQAPPYCFTNPNGSSSSSPVLDQDLANGHMFRLQAARQVHREAQHLQQQQKEKQEQQKKQAVQLLQMS